VVTASVVGGKSAGVGIFGCCRHDLSPQPTLRRRTIDSLERTQKKKRTGVATLPSPGLYLRLWPYLFPDSPFNISPRLRRSPFFLTLHNWDRNRGCRRHTAPIPESPLYWIGDFVARPYGGARAEAALGPNRPGGPAWCLALRFPLSIYIPASAPGSSDLPARPAFCRAVQAGLLL